MRGDEEGFGGCVVENAAVVLRKPVFVGVEAERESVVVVVVVILVVVVVAGEWEELCWCPGIENGLNERSSGVFAANSGTNEVLGPVAAAVGVVVSVGAADGC